MAKRKHTKTGSPKGGRREGAGRKPGTSNALPLGAVAATKAFATPSSTPSHRTEGLAPEKQALADEAFATYADVMRKPSRGALFRLQAARYIREELCPPIPKKLEHTGKDGGPVSVSINFSREPRTAGDAAMTLDQVLASGEES